MAGLLAFALFASAVLTFSLIGTTDGAPAAAWGEALEKNGLWAQLSGFLHALTGLSLAAFAWTLHRAASRGGQRGIAPWGLFGGIGFAMWFVLGGAVIFASVEAATYQQDAEAGKTLLILGHLLYANPIAALMGGAFAFACGLATLAGFPAWFRPLSQGLGGLAMATTLLGSVGGIGLIGMGPLALWLLVAAALAALRLPRGTRPSDGPQPSSQNP